MIDRREYCIDILQQTAALRAAVDSVALLILEDHVQDACARPPSRATRTATSRKSSTSSGEPSASRSESARLNPRSATGPFSDRWARSFLHLRRTRRDLSTFVEEWSGFVENLVDGVGTGAYSPSSAPLLRTVKWVTALAKGRGNRRRLDRRGKTEGRRVRDEPTPGAARHRGAGVRA